MSETANKILESFDLLDPSEKHSVVVSLLSRAGELPATPLTDDELCGIADDLLSSLDDEEYGSAHSQ